MIFLAERGVDVSKRTILRWVQTFGPLLAAEIRKHRRRPGRRWWVDEVFFVRNKRKEKRSLYRAIDEHGQVLDILFGDRRATEAATAFFRRARRHTGSAPTAIIRDHHQPYLLAVQEVFPAATHSRTGLHRAHGETTKPIEHSHVPTRDRLRSSRGMKTVPTGQRFFEGFEALQALAHGHVHLERLGLRSPSVGATPHEQARMLVRAVDALGARLRRAA